MNLVHQRATQVARTSYGKLVALLASRNGDIIGAEDALSDAFQKALEVWPQKGIPNNPQAWLFTTARNRLIDLCRHAKRYPHDSLEQIESLASSSELEPENKQDNRLELMFVCAHPAISPSIRTPLMLQTVLGLEATVIARAFFVSPAAMAQRLVRAKQKIREANIPFKVPDNSEMPNRLSFVLEAIYAAFSIDLFCGRSTDVENLSIEALYLVNLLIKSLPQEPEALGLAALISFSQSREQARITELGKYVPLNKQNESLWNKKLIHKAETLLKQASLMKKMGRFQLEAAIQSVHCNRVLTGKTDWTAILHLYQGLISLSPTIGAAVGRAAAIGEAIGAQEGLISLSKLDKKQAANFQPALATKAYLLSKLGRNDEAIQVYQTALEMTVNPILKEYLTACQRELAKKMN